MTIKREKGEPFLDTGAGDLQHFVRKETTMTETKFDFEKLLQLAEARGGFQFHAEIKAFDDKKRTIEGYANTKNVDRVGEVVEPAAFNRTVKPFLKNGKILRNHDWREPVGLPVDGKVDEKGFWIRAKIEEGIGYIDETWEQIKRGLLNSFSIGYRILKAVRPDDDPKDHRDPWRIIKQLDLYEVSVVTIPANVQSTFSMAKGLQHGGDLWLPGTDAWGIVNQGNQLQALQPVEVDEPEPFEPYAATADYMKNVTAELKKGGARREAAGILVRMNERLKNGGNR